MTAQEGEGWGGVSILDNTFKISVNIEFKHETQVYFYKWLAFLCQIQFKAVTLVCENPMGIFTVSTREPRN